jgi:hypothetical protein
MLNRPGNLNVTLRCGDTTCPYNAGLCNERFCVRFKIEDCFKCKDWTLNNSLIISRKVVNAILELGIDKD